MNLTSLKLTDPAKAVAVSPEISSLPASPLILAVDDDEDSLYLIHTALNLFGFANISTCSSVEAIQLARTHRPSLILLDIVMPEINGFEVVHYLKHHPETQEIPVVAVTVLAKPEDCNLLLQAGFKDYLIKPYGLDELEAMLNRHVDRQSTIV